MAFWDYYFNDIVDFIRAFFCRIVKVHKSTTAITYLASLSAMSFSRVNNIWVIIKKATPLFEDLHDE